MVGRAEDRWPLRSRWTQPLPDVSALPQALPMITQRFMNPPVRELARTVRFFKQVGLPLKEPFTDQNAACVKLGRDSFAMLLALSVPSREEVNRLVDKAMGAGALPHGEARDHGFMYQRSFSDPDGQVWGILWMDETQMRQVGAGRTCLFGRSTVAESDAWFG